MDLFWCLLLLFLQPSLSVTTKATSLVERDYSRGLQLVTTIFLQKRSWIPPFKTIYYVHTALQFDAVGSEPALRVQLMAVPDSIRRETDLHRFKQSGGGDRELLLSLFGREMEEDYIIRDANLGSVRARTYTHLGTVDYSNAQVMEPRRGTGLAWDAWKIDTTYRSGKVPTGQVQVINDCNSFTQRLLQKMNVDLPETSRRVLDASMKYSLHSADYQNVDITLGMYKSLKRNDQGGKWTTFRSIGNPSSPPPRPQYFDPYRAPELGEATFLLDNPYTPLRLESIPEDPGRISYDGPLDRAMRTDWGLEESQDVSAWDRNLCQRVKKRNLVTRGCIPRSVFAEGEIFAVSSRVSGSLQTIRVVATGVAEALGAAATVASAVFVIIDFVNHKWIGGGFALAGLIGGIAVAALVSGPAGWILAAGVTAFFMILPGAFAKAAHPPRIDDKQQILRWATFGDSTHTGDEGCKEQHPGANCTVVYGAGVLSLVFQWDNFDSIAFLTRYNDGWAMTLPEIAEVFQVVDSRNPNATAQAPAAIDCGTPSRMPSRWRMQQGDPKWCPKPNFVLRREQIVLPNINQTADQVYKRIVPQSGGDCLLVNEAAKKEYLPDYNITVLGGQAAIACNLSAGLDNGTAVIPLDNQGLPVDIQGQTINATAILDQVATNLTASLSSNDTASNGTFDTISNQKSITPPSRSPLSPGSASTDNQAGHHIDPPAPTPFQNHLLNATNAACLSGPGSTPLCLPNGTYSVQDGTTGSVSTTKVTALTLPPGASLSFTLTTPGRNGQHPLTTQRLYTGNSTGANADDDFATSIARILPSQCFSISIPPSLNTGPALCLFTQPHFLGQVICLGPGGGNVPDAVKGKVQSLRVYGGATAWVYASFYGDLGGLRVGSDVQDLGGVGYGPEENWGGRLLAVWVLGP